ncbi:MAG: amidohydrolase [Burkholderiales bacterium]|nr:amidohydrolase [Burkholderiales bacterium]
MTIIDFRLRPPLKGFLESHIFKDPARRNRFTRRLGFEPAPSAENRSLDLLFEEMDAVGVTTGLCVGRYTSAFGVIPNADVAAIAKEYPGRFFPAASIEGANRRAAMREIEACLALGLRMFNLEPGASAEPMHVDDRRLYPLYAFFEDHKLPVMLMTGGMPGPDISFTDPARIDRVLADFPDLTVICSHGNWPWVDQIIAVAFRRPNLYVQPDMYLYNLPGMEQYLRAANGFLAERFLFGTAYPLCPVKEYTEWFLKLPIRAEAMENILFRNAERLIAMCK